jgi:hypothetical protein
VVVRAEALVADVVAVAAGTDVSVGTVVSVTYPNSMSA